MRWTGDSAPNLGRPGPTVSEATWGVPGARLAAGLGLVLLVAVGGGCGRAEVDVSIDDQNVATLAGDDAAMNEAIAQARAHLGVFERELADAKPGRVFLVKKRFAVGDAAEHIWVVGVKKVEGGFEGEIDNDPVAVAGVHAGDRHVVARADVSDWMIADEDGKLWGAYTTRVLLSQMPADLRRAREAKLQPLPK